MPAKSEKQRMAIAIALHEPGKLYKRNRSLLGMSKEQMRDYVQTSEKSLPERALAEARNRRHNKKMEIATKKKKKKDKEEIPDAIIGIVG